MNLKIRNGTVITAAKTFKADIGINDNKIVKIAPSIKDWASDEIDATGKFLLPGGVDVHTHFDMPFGGTVTSDNFYTGTVAAACGGTTTIIDFAIPEKGQTLQEAIAAWHKKANGKAVIDYSFHIALTQVSEKTYAELAALVKDGITSAKLFMAYKGNLMVDDAALYSALMMSKELGFLTMLHCENGDVIDLLQRAFLSSGKTKPIHHALSRPPELEDEAVSRAITFSKMVGVPVYIVHLSSAGALEKVKLARLNKLPIYAETCPHYLALSMDKYKLPGFEGSKYVMSPPLRLRHNITALWKGVENGHLQAVSSDHCAFNFQGQKDMGKDDFTKIPNGVPGVETRLAILFNEGVATKRISMNKLVDIFATAPAKIFGLHPRKGDIAIGSDADIVIFDPDRKFSRKALKLHQDVDYTPFEGYRGRGAVETVIARGKVIFKGKGFTGKKGDGVFLPRQKHKV